MIGTLIQFMSNLDIMNFNVLRIRGFLFRLIWIKNEGEINYLVG